MLRIDVYDNLPDPVLLNGQPEPRHCDEILVLLCGYIMYYCQGILQLSLDCLGMNEFEDRLNEVSV